MPKISSYDQFRVVMGPWTGALTTQPISARHKAFCYFASANVVDPSSYSFFACLQTYKVDPSKRKAIFIYEKFMKTRPTTGATVATEADLLGQINTGSIENQGGNMEVALKGKISDLQKIKTWKGKLTNLSLAIKGSKPSADLFAHAENIFKGSMNDYLGRVGGYPFNTDSVYRASGFYSGCFATARRELESVGFDPDTMGIWGGA